VVNGGFSVQLKGASGWQEIGSLRFDEFFDQEGLKVVASSLPSWSVSSDN